MKQYLSQETVSTLIGFLILLLSENIVAFTGVQTIVVMVVIGFLLGFGYTIPKLDQIVKYLYVKKGSTPIEPPKEETIKVDIELGDK